MADKLPRVLGLAELLEIKSPLKGKAAPLVYFSEREFRRLLAGVDELKRPPRRTSSLPTFTPVAGGGVVQSACTSPEGQICLGQWIPAGLKHGSGVFFGCRCRGPEGTPEIDAPTCQLKLDGTSFTCVGECSTGGHVCKLGYWRDISTGTVVLECRCRPRSGKPV